MKLIVALAAALAIAANAAAQTYPTRPVTVVVGFAPGGGTDTVGRVMQRKLGEFLGQSIVVENRAGAGGAIAPPAGAKTTPGGHTIPPAPNSAPPRAPDPKPQIPHTPPPAPPPAPEG